MRPFLKLLVKVVDFGATPESAPVLAAMKSLPELMGRKKVGPAETDTELLAPVPFTVRVAAAGLSADLPV